MGKHKPANERLRPSASQSDKLACEKLIKAASRLPTERKRELLERIDQMLTNPSGVQELMPVMAPLSPQAAALTESFTRWLENARSLPQAEQASLHKRIQHMLDTNPLAGSVEGVKLTRRSNQVVYFDRLVRGAVKLPEGWKLFLRDKIDAEIRAAS